MAVETGGRGLFLTNYLAGRIEIWDKTTGIPIDTSALALPHPLGIAIDPRGGSVWIAYGDGLVSQFSYDESSLVIDPTPLRTIIGLQDPYGVTVANLGTVSDPRNYRLHVNETARSKIREYDINGSVPVNSGPFADFGQHYTPGPLADDEFGWQDPGTTSAIAVSGDGVVSVADPFDRRVQRFRADGTLYQSMFREYVPSPWVDPASISGDTHDMISGGFEYEVNVAGGTFSDGMANDSWRLVDNWTPVDGKFFSSSFFSPTRADIARHQQGTGLPPLYRTFLFNVDNGGSGGMAIYAVESDSIRRSSIVGSSWIGNDGTLAPTKRRLDVD